MKHYKKSNEPVVWLLFGAGGLVGAYLLPALVLVLGILIPLGIIDPLLFSYERSLDFLNNIIGKIILFALLSLSFWHTLHRIFHGLHDLKIKSHNIRFIVCYGGAFILTLYSAYILFL